MGHPVTASSPDWVLVVVAALHLVLALGCALALLLPAPPLLGVHPALKPLKFAVSIALFLGSMALLLPVLDVAPETRRAVGWVLSVAMVIEMIPITVQPLRGTTSHFNVSGATNVAMWLMMVGAIVVTTVVMAGVAVLASVRSLAGDPLVATAWRAGLWIFMLAAVSGFAMGSRLKHSVGGADGGPGFPFVNWSTRHGDLRVAHFFALHALQSLPLLAVVLRASPLNPSLHGVVLWLIIGLHVALSVGTLVQSFAGRPAW